jgi:hypothetical protein
VALSSSINRTRIRAPPGEACPWLRTLGER